MASTSTRSPGTVANVTLTGQSWSNPSNARSSDNSYAVFTPVGTYGAISDYLRATNFGFAIPSEATINGILVEIERYADYRFGNEAEDWEVRIVKGGVIGSEIKMSEVVWPISEKYTSFGGSADLWSETWSPSDINSSDFGVVLSAISLHPEGGTPSSLYVDHFRITVFYTEATTDVNTSPSTQSATFSQPSPTITTQKKVSVSVNEQTITFSQPSTTVTATKSVTASMEAQGLSASLPAPTVSTAQSVTIQPSVQSLTASQPEPTVSAAFLAVGKIALASPAHLSSGELTTCFVWEIPSFTTGRNVSFQLQIDKTDDTFGDIEVSKDSRKDSGFQYWDGEAWRDFGAEGVPVEYVGNQARIQVTLPTDGRKYWRVRGYS
jgi:hypothetical protein